ncbi:hypothetical protein GCM10028781_01310 [Nostocoides australiense]
MSPDNPSVAASDAERLARHGGDVGVEVRQHQAFALKKTLVAYQVLHGRSPPPARIVPHPGMHPEPPNRTAARHVAPLDVSQGRFDLRPHMARVSDGHIDAGTPHTISVHPRPRNRDADTPRPRKRDSAKFDENLQEEWSPTFSGNREHRRGVKG